MYKTDQPAFISSRRHRSAKAARLARSRAAGGGFCAAIALVATTVRAEFVTPTAILDARIVTGTGEIIEPGTLILAEGRILALGKSGTVVVPPDAERVDATGLTAYPGFIDAMSLLGVPDAPRAEEARQRLEDAPFDAREGPAPETSEAVRRGIRAHLRAYDVYAPKEEALTAHRKAGFTTALIAPRAGIFAGRSDLMNLSDAPIRRTLVRGDVAMHAAFETGEPGDYPGTLLGEIALLRQTLLDARWWTQMRDYAARRPRTAPRVAHDADLDALQAVLARRQPVIFEANTEVEIRRALALADEFGLDPILSGAREAHKAADLLRERGIPVIVSLRFDEEPEFGRKRPEATRKPDPAPAVDNPPETGAPPDSADQKSEAPDPDKSAPQPSAKPEEKTEDREARFEPLKVRQERRRLWEEQAGNLMKLIEAQAPVAIRTSDLKSADEFWKNLRKVIERGLTEEAAVRVLTSSPAQILAGRGTAAGADLRHQVGSLAPERLANVTLMSAPLTDEKAKVRYVFVDGRKFEFDPTEKDKASDKKPGEDKTEPTRGAAPQSEKSSVPDGAAAEESAPAAASAPEDERGPTFESEIKADRIPKTRTGGNVLVRDATVIPVSGPTLPRASILVQDGKIVQIGEDVAVPDGVTVIDASGRFIMPGIVDAHSHLGIDGVNESALAISAEVRIEDVINPSMTGVYRALAGGVTTAHVMHGSANPIGGQCDVIKHKYLRPAAEAVVPDAPRTIKFALGENVIQSNRPAAGPARRFPASRTGVETTYRRAFEEAADYAREHAEFARRREAGEDAPPPRRDLRLEALSEVLSGSLFVHCHCYRSDEILRFLDLMEEYGVRVGVLQHVWDGYRIAPEIARHGCGASSFASSWAYKIEAEQAVPHNAAMLARHGVCASINSDSADYIRYLASEAAKSMRWGGLGEIETLRLVTLDAARQLHVDHRLGSLEVGKDADLAIFNGHPLNAFSKCVMTLIEGEVYFEDDRPEASPGAAEAPAVRDVQRAISPAEHRAYAILNATVHPISGPPIERANVILLDDRIHAVGPGVEAPPGAGVLDAEGLHVYPGLIDAGTTVTLDEVESLRATNMSGEIGTFQPDVRAASAAYPFNVHVFTTRASGFTTVLAVPRGPQIAGQSAIAQLDGWTAKEMLLSESFGLHVTLPTLPLHLPQEDRSKREEEHKKQIKALEDFLARAKHYAAVKDAGAGDGQKRAYDPRLEAMRPFVRGERPVVFHANAHPHIVESVEFARKHGLKCVVFGGQEAWKSAAELAKNGVAVIHSGPTGMPGEFEPWDSVYRCAGELDRAGVTVAFGSGAGDVAFTMPMDVALSVAHGWTAERAERALTLGAAEILGIADRLGSIEPGKQADLIVTTGSPIQAATRVTHVFIRGAPVDLTNMHSENVDRFSRRPAPSLPPAPTLRGPKNLTRNP
ncbi:MAG: Adenine deaminase [Phycisphaerae bacterium]|nr:Adenine deaminase [Phycisphaerae bacterium]